MLLIQETITAIRNLRKQVNLAPGLEVDVLIKVSEKTQKELLKSYLGYLQKLAKVKNARIGICVFLVVARSDSTLFDWRGMTSSRR